MKLENISRAKLTPVEPGTMFILFCMTCGVNFVHFKKNPENDPFVLAAADVSVAGHVMAYSRPHKVELLDVKIRNSAPYPLKPQLIQ